MSPIVLENGGARAEIALLGAELRGWQVDGAALIWTPDPAIWNATAPILFPVVGWTRGASVSVDGQTYPLGLHGFARDLPFRVLEQGPSHIRLGLTSDAETRALYPFDWSLQLDYALDGPAIVTRLTICNESARAMPYACGLHPGFRWPFVGGDMKDYAILFGGSESASVPIISADGLFTRQSRRVSLDGRRLALSPALLEHEALCFLEARSTGIEFRHTSGAAIAITLENFRHIAIWSRPAGRFLSIEAWTGHGDYVDADGDLYTKPSMHHLETGESASHVATYTFKDVSEVSYYSVI